MTKLAKEFDVARLTVRVVAMLLECTFVEQLQTEGTSKVVRMELLSHGRNALASDGFLALSTQSTSLGMVMDLAVRLAF